MAAPCITRSASQNHELAAYTQTATDRRPSAHTKRHHLNQLRRDRSCLLRDKGQSARLTLVASTVVAHAYRRPAPSDCVISCIVLQRVFAVRCSVFCVLCFCFSARLAADASKLPVQGNRITNSLDGGRLFQLWSSCKLGQTH